MLSAIIASAPPIRYGRQSRLRRAANRRGAEAAAGTWTSPRLGVGPLHCTGGGRREPTVRSTASPPDVAGRTCPDHGRSGAVVPARAVGGARHLRRVPRPRVRL